MTVSTHIGLLVPNRKGVWTHGMNYVEYLFCCGRVPFPSRYLIYVYICTIRMSRIGFRSTCTIIIDISWTRYIMERHAIGVLNMYVFDVGDIETSCQGA